MESKDLLKFWASRDNSKLSAKQLSIRLPTHIAARISALCEIYPSKNRTQIISDLLSTALDNLEDGMSYDESDEPKFVHPEVGDIYAVYGPGTKGHYLNTANKHLTELESELGNDEPELFHVVTEYDDRY